MAPLLALRRFQFVQRCLVGHDWPVLRGVRPGESRSIEQASPVAERLWRQLSGDRAVGTTAGLSRPAAHGPNRADSDPLGVDRSDLAADRTDRGIGYRPSRGTLASPADPC